MLLRDPNAMCQGFAGSRGGEWHIVGCHGTGDEDEVKTVY